jgi:hypothetical protein
MSTRSLKTASPLKLPASLPDGTRITIHPLVWYVKNKMGQDNKSDLSRHMDVRPQSLYKWLAECRRDRHFALPLDRAMQIADFFGIHPRVFRPDVLWPTKL